MMRRVILCLLLSLCLPGASWAVTDRFYNMYWDGSSPLRHYGYLRYDSGALFDLYDSDADSLLRYNETAGQFATSYDGVDSFLVNTLTGDLSLGRDGQDEDISISFLANTADGLYTWMEDEDYLLASDDILWDTTERAYFRDTAISISSQDDGHIDIAADTSIDLNLDTSSIAITDTTDQFFDLSLGSTYFRNQTGDFYFGHTGMTLASFRHDVDLGFGALPFTGFYMDDASDRLFYGILDATGIGGAVEPAFGYWDSASDITTPQMMMFGHATAVALGSPGDTLPRFALAKDSGSGGTQYFGVFPDGAMVLGNPSPSPEILSVYPAARAAAMNTSLMRMVQTWTHDGTGGGVDDYQARGMELGVTVDPGADFQKEIVGFTGEVNTAGTHDYLGDILAAKFVARHMGTGDMAAAKALTGGSFEVLVGPLAGGTERITAGFFTATSDATSTGPYDRLTLCAVDPAHWKSDLAELFGYLVNDLNPPAGSYNVTDELVGIKIRAPSSDGGASVFFGIDSEWSSRMQDNVAWWFGTGKDAGVYHDTTLGGLRIDTADLFLADSAASYTPNLHVRTTNSVALYPSIRLEHFSASPADDDGLGTIEWRGYNDAVVPEDIVFAYINVLSSDVTDGTEDADWQLLAKFDGTFRNVLYAYDDAGSKKIDIGGATLTRVLIDTALEVATSALIGTSLEIDGDLNHDGTGVGFYGTAPVTQPTGVADATGAGDVVATVNAVIDRLEDLGLFANLD